MTTQGIVTRYAQGQIRNWEGETLGFLILNGDGAAGFTDAVGFVADIVADEIDTGDAPGYARGELLMAWEQVESSGTLTRDPGETVPVVDLDGAPSVGMVVWYDTTGGSDATDQVLFGQPYATPYPPGTADWEIDPANGVATVGVQYTPAVPTDWLVLPDNLAAALDEVAARLTALEP